MEPLDEYLDMVYLSNLLTGLDLIGFLPLLDLWEIKFVDDDRKIQTDQGERYATNAYFQPGERPTVCINRAWARENLRSPEEVVTILLHECLHQLLGYYDSYDSYLVEAWECFINQTIAVLVRGNPAYLDIIRRTFQDRPFPSNFRCDKAHPQGYLQARMYRCLYDLENPGASPPYISEEDVTTTYTQYGHTHRLPHPVFLLDPHTLAELFADEDGGARPRTKEEWEECFGQAPVVGQVDPESELGKALGESGLGQTMVGSLAAPESEDDLESLPDSLPPEVASGMLAGVGGRLTEMIADKARNVNEEAERRYLKKIPASTRRLRDFPYRPYRTALGAVLQAGSVNREMLGRASRSPDMSTLARATERERLFVRKADLRRDLERVSLLDEKGRIECFFRGKARKSPTRSPRPSFRRDRLASSLLLQGRVPASYRRKDPDDPHGLVHLFADVSGSCTSYVPTFLAFMESMSDIVHPDLKLFSTKVVVADIQKTLRTRKYDSTGGTNLDCVINFAREHGIHLACVMSDGYMNASEENMNWARQNMEIVTLSTPEFSKTCQLAKLSTIVADLSSYAKGKR